MTKTTQRRHPRGFGLIEVMISATILAGAMVSTLSALSMLTAAQEHDRQFMRGLHIAETTMEGLLVRYSNDPLLTAGPHTGSAYTREGVLGGSYFTATWVVTPDVPILTARELVVTVTWSERGRARSAVLRTVRL